MHATPLADVDDATPDDRSTRARIRDAAIETFATHGWADTTARKVADAAGVSPGSVIHHFTTMDGLREACDHHVARTIRDAKLASIEQGADLDLLGALRNAPVAAIGRYLARMLSDGPAAADLVDELVEDARDYLDRGVEAGVVRPSDDPDARAAVVLLQGLGMVVLHHHVQRLLGVDITDPATSAEDLGAYARPTLEVYSHGLFTAAFAATADDAFPATADEASPPAREQLR